MLRIVFVAFALVSPVVWAGDDLFSGTWKLNIAKSKLTPPIPRSHRAIIHADSSGVRVREEIVEADGEPVTVTFECNFDGKDYPVTGSAFADTVAMTRVDGHTIKSVVKKDGKVILSETEVVSQDGKTLRADYSATDSEGKTITGVAVLDKTAP